MVINGFISRVTIHIRGLITPLITTHEPPSRLHDFSQDVDFGRSWLSPLCTNWSEEFKEACHRTLNP